MLMIQEHCTMPLVDETEVSITPETDCCYSKSEVTGVAEDDVLLKRYEMTDDVLVKKESSKNDDTFKEEFSDAAMNEHSQQESSLNLPNVSPIRKSNISSIPANPVGKSIIKNSNAAAESTKCPLPLAPNTPPPAFVTTSSLVHHLNTNLQKHMPELMLDDDNNKKPRFELNKRLPDGSAVPASPNEIASTDFEQKLGQTAAILTNLRTERDKLQWCQDQRRRGNELFALRKYKAAMDIYLTCLTVCADTDKTRYSKSSKTEEEPPKVDDETQQQLKKEHHQRLKMFVKVMSNLSLCTWKLSWMRKTIDFCTLGVDYMEQQQEMIRDETIHDRLMLLDDIEDDNADAAPYVDEELTLGMAKLYLRRAKAIRVRGDDLTLAGKDLAHVEHVLMLAMPTPEDDDAADNNSATNNTTDHSTSNSYLNNASLMSGSMMTDDGELLRLKLIRVWDRERILLDRAEVRLEQSTAQQKSGMQRQFGESSPVRPKSPPPSASTQKKKHMSGVDLVKAAVTPLYDSLQQERQYSTVRRRKTAVPKKLRFDDDEVPVSYWRWYRKMIARNAQKLVDWIDAREEQRRVDGSATTTTTTTNNSHDSKKKTM